ncbi:protein GRAVITROPIC IN THE LIGHT 1 [Mangifera indica]|uniref:protein GRAVITROPIC IN THE LIGHT 1 n=1 Tax=Mangifera indica TaxID=29780 RepID=UPI001CFA5C94|nr:protein GRAVITROPIC IN THE LIGHT 1 [Mangifera indica]XP_044504993.1 protein GRAVITROPIC IN THE LIGHT 1 [Mangifera indica]
MAAKVCNFSDLIERVAASCLLHPLANARQDLQNIDDDEEEQHYEYKSEEEEEEEEEKRERGVENVREGTVVSVERVIELETIMSEVFEAFSAMKKAYISLQGAHCPWDPERMRVADVAIVGEMRRVSVLRERWFRRRRSGGGGGGGRGMVREVVAPYEAAVEDLKKEVKAREIEVENLKAKLKNVTSNLSSSKKGKSLRKVNYISQAPQVVAAPAPELFEATMSLVKEASKSFTLMLLSLMRAAHWDIAAAVRSIEAASANGPESATIGTSSVMATHQAKYALESYISRKIFQGFDHETFYMDGSLSSLINPDQYRRDCYTQFNDMKAMDPVELLGILPTCNFGKFCCKKYLAVVHPKMEESLFGDLEQHRQVLSGNHPRSQFYGEFLRLAKTIWLLHLLAFSLDPAPCQFEASRGGEFHPQYMVSVVKLCGGKPPPGQIVGFPVSPGFKLGNGTVIKARVYLVSRS